ncbi:LacI family DNA-binding transcriptional regulator [Kribbella sp. NPDC002412]
MASGRDRSLPTSKDVAALAGVSQSTVSYVLSGKRPISPETRQRVEAAIAELTYQPNAGARALRGRRTNVIALVVRLSGHTDVPDTLPYVDTVVEEARKRDFDVILVTSGDGPEELTRLARRSICDAIVLMDIRRKDDRVATVANLGVPVVLIGTTDDNHGLDSVDYDARRAGESMVAELVATGHRHAVLIGERPQKQREFFFAGEFHRGVTRAAKAARLDLLELHRSGPGWGGVSDLADELFSGDRLGIIARTPNVIGWVLQLAALRQLVPGRDFSLVGQCTDDTAVSYSTPVSNVSTEPRAVSRLAMSILFDQLDGVLAAGGKHHVVEPQALTRRASTADFS